MSRLALELADACLAANEALIKGQQDEITILRQQLAATKEH